jgi:hypothetical protein
MQTPAAEQIGHVRSIRMFGGSALKAPRQTLLATPEHNARVAALDMYDNFVKAGNLIEKPDLAPGV